MGIKLRSLIDAPAQSDLTHRHAVEALADLVGIAVQGGAERASRRRRFGRTANEA